MRRITRFIYVGKVVIGGDAPVVIQSMTATKTTDVAATVAMIRALSAAGGKIIRVAVDSPRDADALREIRAEISEISKKSGMAEVAMAVDLQENWKLAEKVAPFVDKIRYNPGHLHHVDAQKTWQEKVAWLVSLAREQTCALRVGVNCGSLDPTLCDFEISGAENGEKNPALASAVAHSRYLDSLGFENYCVSLKDSNPRKVVAANRVFAAICPEVPLHLGVTEAGIPPDGILKSRLALEPLLASGIGETLRVSLTVPNERKCEEIAAGKEILANVARGEILTAEKWSLPKLNLISCPSCARVENEAFVSLAEKVRDATRFAENKNLTIAVMGCRVNGPGETDHADFGIWCGAQQVTLKRKTEKLGDYDYCEVIPQLVELIKKQLK